MKGVTAHEIHGRAVNEIRVIEVTVRSAFKALYEAQQRLAHEGVTMVVAFSPEIDAAYSAWTKQRNMEAPDIELPPFIGKPLAIEEAS